MSSLLILAACKKEHVTANNIAILNVVNGIINKDVLLNINGSISNSGANMNNNRQNVVFFGTNTFYYAEAKNTSMGILSNTDSSMLLSKSFDLKKGGNYTLLLAGISPNVETVLIDDFNMPYVNQSTIPTIADSIINVRFINLAPDVPKMDVRIKGATNNEISGLAYKGYSVFKTYSGKITDYWGTQGYSLLTFEFVVNGNIVSTYPLYLYEPWNRYKNMALVVTGMKAPGSGQPSLTVNEVYYFQ